jgi:ornithine decarboxylase/lysine decarboxylase/arginine decarboxylase
VLFRSPPGIPLLIPGEVFNSQIVDYLKFAREFAKQCPGFETDIHGLVKQLDDKGEVRFYADCVMEQPVPGRRRSRSKAARPLTMDDMIAAQQHTPFTNQF